jgi:hypothetical protein
MIARLERLTTLPGFAVVAGSGEPARTHQRLNLKSAVRDAFGRPFEANCPGAVDSGVIAGPKFWCGVPSRPEGTPRRPRRRACDLSGA